MSRRSGTVSSRLRRSGRQGSTSSTGSICSSTEYAERAGWGHSTLRHAVDLAAMAEVGTLVTFHHDPEHSDQMLDEQLRLMIDEELPIELVPGRAGTAFEL
jgi:phosphoribosyl 1,2-cyclic phosphodiesterase